MQVNLEDLITLNEARSFLPGRTHLSTIYRWCFAGCRGVKLEYRLVGRRICTSRQWLDQFIVEMTARDPRSQQAGSVSSDHKPHRSVQQRERQIAEAEERLAAAGFGKSGGPRE